MKPHPDDTPSRYAMTYRNRDGYFQLVTGNQGRHFRDDFAEAVAGLRSFYLHNSPDTLAQIFGVQALGTFMVSSIDCYQTGDARGIYTDNQIAESKIDVVYAVQYALEVREAHVGECVGELVFAKMGAQVWDMMEAAIGGRLFPRPSDMVKVIEMATLYLRFATKVRT